MTKDSKIIAIIPARGKSKRLPGKNIIDFLGKPLIAYSIQAAKESALVHDVFVTTDDEEIARVAREYGAKVIIRPDELASDTASTADALKHAINREEILAEKPVAILTLQPTSPLRPKDLIDNCIYKFITTAEELDAVISVSTNRNKIGVIENDFYVPTTYQTGQRSQDMPITYYENGLVYVTRTDLILDHGDVFGKKVKTVVVDSIYAEIDIDTHEDLEWAKFVAKNY